MIFFCLQSILYAVNPEFGLYEAPLKPAYTSSYEAITVYGIQLINSSESNITQQTVILFTARLHETSCTDWIVENMAIFSILIILACLHVHSVRSAIGKSNLSTTSWSNNIKFKHLDVMPNFLVSYN